MTIVKEVQRSLEKERLSEKSCGRFNGFIKIMTISINFSLSAASQGSISMPKEITQEPTINIMKKTPPRNF